MVRIKSLYTNHDRIPYLFAGNSLQRRFTRRMKHAKDKLRVFPNDSGSKTRKTLSRASAPLFLEDFRSRLPEQKIVNRRLGNTKKNCIVTTSRSRPDPGWHFQTL